MATKQASADARPENRFATTGIVCGSASDNWIRGQAIARHDARRRLLSCNSTAGAATPG